MEDFLINLVTEYASVLEKFGYALVFAITITESLPAIGMILPGQTIIVLSGFLIKADVFEFTRLATIVSIGAIIGDIAGFFIGRYYGQKILHNPKFKFIKKPYVDKARALIKAHKIKSIFLGRFNSLTRTFIPFAAGMSDISFGAFGAISIASGISWAIVSVGVGFLFGQSFKIGASVFGTFVVAATAIGLFLAWLVYYARKKDIHIGRNGIVMLSFSSLALLVFWLIGDALKGTGVLEMINEGAPRWTRGAPEFLLDSMVFLSEIGGTFSAVLLTSVVVLGFFLLHRYRQGFVFAFAVGIGSFLTVLAKAFISSPRPENLFSEAGSSFPSAHSAVAAMIAFMLWWKIFRHIKNNFLRFAIYIPLVLLPLLIGYSRVYLGVHYATDVIAGFAFGVLWCGIVVTIVNFVRIIIRRAKKKHEIPNVL